MKFIKKSLLFCLFILTVLSIEAQTGHAAKGSRVRFAFLADLHISDVATNVEDLEISVNDINNLKDIDFVIFAGDITEFGSDEEIELAKSIISRLNIPYYVLSGNHDSKWSESGCNTFAKVFGYEYFSFDAGGVQFIGTNSGPNMRMAPALVPREAMVWLDSVTRALPREKPVVFINHYPLDDAMLNYAQVIDMLKRVNIQASLCGHGHSNRVMDFSGIRGVMGRSNLRAGKAAAGHAGYNIVSIETGGNTASATAKIDKDSDYSFGKISFTVRSNGITQEPWYTMPLLKHSANPVMHAPVGVVWEFQDDSDIGSAAAYAFGNVYISNTAGVIKALDAADGCVKWSFATGGKVFSSPEVCEKSGVLVVGSTDNFIYGLDARSGKLRWRAEALKSVLGSPSILGDLVYIGASDGVFRAIDVMSGKVVWSYNGIKSFIEAKPWADADGVYIGDWANRVYAFEPKTGKLMWEWTNRKGRGLSAAAVWPVKANGKLFVVTPERRSHAIDAKTGKELWSARGGREAIGLSEDGSAVYIKTMQDTVIAFSTIDYNIAGNPSASAAGKTSSAGAKASAKSDEKVSNNSAGNASSTTAANTSNSTFGSPAEYNSAVNVTGNTPIKLWESHTGYGYEIAPSPMTAANGLIFVPTDKGNIFALNAADGTVAWQYRFSIALINYIRPISNRRLLVTSMDGKVAILNY